jgi:predicted nucleotidyltransferase
VDEVARQFHPQRVILFGSHARGAAGVDSDVDLLVVMPYTGRGAQQAARIRQRVPAGFPLDLIVRDPESVEQRLALGDPFVKDVLAEGQVLHEAAGT